MICDVIDETIIKLYAVNQLDPHNNYPRSPLITDTSIVLWLVNTWVFQVIYRFHSIKQIEEIRRDELKAKEVKEKSYVQMQLIEKDKKIKELTKMVKLYESGKLQG